MRRPPRPPGSPILDRFVLIRTALVALLMASGAIGVFLFEYHRETGRGIAHDVAVSEAQTIAVSTVILFQSLYLLQSRSLRDPLRVLGLWTNPSVYLGIGTLLTLQLGFVYLPFMNALFGSAPLAAHAWAAALAAALVVLPAIGLEKRWRQRRVQRHRAAVRPPSEELM